MSDGRLHIRGVLRDVRGTPIFPGDEVAYNISGDVAKGRVVRVHPNAWGHSAVRVEVELLHKAAGKMPGHVSKVKRVRSVLVLLGGED